MKLRGIWFVIWNNIQLMWNDWDGYWDEIEAECESDD